MLKIDTLFLQPFADETLRTLKDQCNLEATPLPMFSKGKRVQTPFDIIGIIGGTSTKLKGSITLCFPRPVFLLLMSGMLNEKITEITRELEDGVAELLNIIFGNAKSTLNQSGHEIQMAIPTVLKGDQVRSAYPPGSIVFVVPFQTKAGEFYIEFLAKEIDLKEDMQALGKKARKIDAMVFQPFVTETINTIRTVGGIECKPTKPYYKQDKPEKLFDIAAVVGLTGRTLNGSFSLCMEKSVFLKIMSHFIGENFSDITSELEDGAAELVNIIFGSAKAVLNENGHQIRMALPTIIRGSGISSNYYAKTPIIVLPFVSPDGEFWIEFTYE
ncbi:MAG: chemotaxis protein CheX [Bdellovibrionota bacterium]